MIQKEYLKKQKMIMNRLQYFKQFLMKHIKEIQLQIQLKQMVIINPIKNLTFEYLLLTYLQRKVQYFERFNNKRARLKSVYKNIRSDEAHNICLLDSGNTVQEIRNALFFIFIFLFLKQNNRLNYYQQILKIIQICEIDFYVFYINCSFNFQFNLFFLNMKKKTTVKILFLNIFYQLVKQVNLINNYIYLFLIQLKC
ncbi:transmembrane protein, putative (macronuclear) [Tetrahymena thermophila SB210]|uniref:Transmembrane protein, putative n=1 Tax=Tetrahymena thermophila (strain SB210) TaxID=312017 RepID=W7X7F0_TETTS|nr:transmembrane protein, putative [Tetrahymena thermophila SB210]EWS72298.1 transmembrane protein, putative [Tetrahymena thermophila SB210]|eukprot:XP_012655167.1 transmembrane protein, putative [Tetrahymena thermophila SB210]